MEFQGASSLYNHQWINDICTYTLFVQTDFFQFPGVSHNYCQWKSECHCYLFLLKVLHHESLVNKKTYHCCVGMSQIYPNLDHFFTHLDLLGQVRTIFRLIDPTCSDCTVEADDIWTSRIGTLTKAWRSIQTTKTWEKIKGGETIKKQIRSVSYDWEKAGTWYV